jgi:hypothetical protein
MSDPSDNRTTDRLPPGAERFWGQVSETRAGRSRSKESGEAGAGTSDAGQEAAGESHACLEWCPICRSADLLRATTPPEAIGQVQAIQQEAVNVLKAFLAAYGDRGGSGGAEPGGRSTSSSGRGSRGEDRGGEDRPADAPGERPFRDIWID